MWKCIWSIDEVCLWDIEGNRLFVGVVVVVEGGRVRGRCCCMRCVVQCPSIQWLAMMKCAGCAATFPPKVKTKKISSFIISRPQSHLSFALSFFIIARLCLSLSGRTAGEHLPLFSLRPYAASHAASHAAPLCILH